MLRAPGHGDRLSGQGDHSITSNAGALLLGGADKAIELVGGLAATYDDRRDPDRIEHAVTTLVGQRIFGIALGHEDLNDHDRLRHDPTLAVLAGKLKATRKDCAPVAGKSTLNRLALSRADTACHYWKIVHNAEAIARLFLMIVVEAHKKPPKRLVLDVDTTHRSDPRRARGPSLQRVLRLLLLSAAVRLL